MVEISQLTADGACVVFFYKGCYWKHRRNDRVNKLYVPMNYSDFMYDYENRTFVLA